MPIAKPVQIDTVSIELAKERTNWLYALIALGLIFRFFYPFFSHPYDHLYSDPDRHYTNIIEANFAKSIYSVLDSPLPQFWLRFIFLIFGDTAIGLATYLGLLCAVTPWFWYRWGREIFRQKNTALIFFAALVFLPSWTGIYTYVMDETLVIPALGAALWLSWRAKRKQTINSLLVASLAWAIAICIKQNVVFELLIVVPWLFIAYLKQWGISRKSLLAVCASGVIIVGAYLTYPLWVYQGLGCAWLFSPAMGCMTRGYFLSGALTHSATFLSQGQLIWQTGDFGSNAMITESLAPFWHWKTWRTGKFNLVIDMDRKFYLSTPVPKPSWKKRLRLMAESALYFFFSRSWPDDRDDDPVQRLQVHLRWLWSFLSLCVLVLGWLKNRLKDMPVVLCLGTALLYIICDCSTIEGRYRKPWEGLAVAAFIYLITEPKRCKLPVSLSAVSPTSALSR